MLLIGCLPEGRKTEQHDVFFGIGASVKEVLEEAIASWPEAKASFHLDAWREVTVVDNYAITVMNSGTPKTNLHLFFLNLGGYKKNEFEEFHYKMLVVAENKNEALKKAKQTAFFKHTGFKGAHAHVDEKYGVDVDNVYLVKNILPANYKKELHLVIEPLGTGDEKEDFIHLGYFRPQQVDRWANG